MKVCSFRDIEAYRAIRKGGAEVERERERRGERWRMIGRERGERLTTNIDIDTQYFPLFQSNATHPS